MVVLHPVPIPFAPLTRTMGTTGTYVFGSIWTPSSEVMGRVREGERVREEGERVRGGGRE